MNAYLSHISAARYWASYGSPGVDRAHRLTSVGWPANEELANRLDAETLNSLGLSPEESAIHVTVARQDLRKKQAGVVYHSCTKPLPEGALSRTDSGVVAASPELTFVNMASVLNEFQLIHFGMMLCGIYATDPKLKEIVDHSGPIPQAKPVHPLHKREPVASPCSLRAFVDKAPWLHGSRQAKAALPYIRGNSRSPMESIAAMLLCLPNRMGGYGLPWPTLNLPSGISASGGSERSGAQAYPSASGRFGQDGTRAGSSVCDLAWMQGGVVLEYLGGPYHTGQRNLHRDSLRNNALKAGDVTLMTLTKEMLYDAEQFDQLANQLAKMLGIRLRITSKKFHARKRELRRSLLQGSYLEG